MPQPAFLQATLPLLQDGLVDALEWSIDLEFHGRPVPEATRTLLDAYADQGRLTAHGLDYSPLTGAFLPHHSAWLDELTRCLERRPYRHLSEHAGWSIGRQNSQGPPLPLPLEDWAVAPARAHMQVLAERAGMSVGLESAALVLCAQDAHEHAALLDAVLAPVGGFIVLDLHNLWCQATNFGVDASALLETYPVERVRELHVSGGSWAMAAGRRFRRDTHDSAVPDDVLALLEPALARFVHAQMVVLESIPEALVDEAAAEQFRADFRRVRACCQRAVDAEPAALAARSAVGAFDDGLCDAQSAVLMGHPGDGALGSWMAGADPAAVATLHALVHRWVVPSIR